MASVLAMYGEPRSSAPYTFTAHVPDIDVDTQLELLRAEMERAEGVVTVSEHNREYLLAGIEASTGLSIRARCHQRVVAPVSDVALPDTKGTPG
jgi:hypothetical protein